MTEYMIQVRATYRVEAENAEQASQLVKGSLIEAAILPESVTTMRTRRIQAPTRADMKEENDG